MGQEHSEGRGKLVLQVDIGNFNSMTLETYGT